MKAKKFICLGGALAASLLCCAVILGTSGASCTGRDDFTCAPAETLEAWSRLVENFETRPFIIHQDTETASDSVEPRISPELEEQIRNASPESVVAYCPGTGAVTLIPYGTLE